MKPTKIIKPPELVLNSDRRFGNGPVHKLMITCDDGITYTVEDLAKEIGIGRSGLHQRLRRLEWDDPMIFVKSAKKGECLDGTKPNAYIERSTEMSKLSCRVRNENLRKIKTLGSWERMQWGI